MKISRKGFMLAEVVVVAVVVAIVLVTLFTGLNSISSSYETRNRYYDVDSLYVAMEVNDILLRNVDTLKDRVSEANRIYVWSSNVSYIDENDIQDFEDFYLNTTEDKIVTYITPYNVDMLLSLSSYDGNTDVTFSEYLEYLSGNLDFEDDYDYIIIVERRENNDVDDCYYYALKLNY